MQIQQSNPSLQALLAKLLPGLGKAVGGAAGGPVGAGVGSLTGAGLEGLLSPQQQEAQMIGGQEGIQQVPPDQNGGISESLIRNLMEQLQGSQQQVQQAASTGMQ